MSKTEFKIHGKKMTRNVNALVDEARKLDLTVEEFEMATEIACKMLANEAKATANIRELDIRAESFE